MAIPDLSTEDVLEAVPSGVLIFDRARRYVWGNAAARAAFVDRPFAGMIGRSYLELFPDLRGTAFDVTFELILAGSEREETLAHFAVYDRWFESTFSAVGGHVLVVFEDVTVQRRTAALARRAQQTLSEDIEVRKRAEEELATAVRMLREASERKDEFIAMLGHELRNPLAPILTAVSVLRVRGDPLQVKAREVIERQARLLVRIVDDLLDVARIRSGKIQLREERVELAEAISHAVETAAPALEQRYHSLSVSVPRGLWVRGDPVRLAQLFGNLLTNAAKYTDPCGNIAIEAAREGTDLRVSVRDDGIGMAAELLERLFEPFVQAEQGLDRAGGGLGLGLAIVRRIAELHGGSVRAHSAGPQRGSEFEVRLPATRGPSADDEAPLELPQQPPPSRGTRILVVDDNQDAAEMLAEHLALSGYEASIALDPQSALGAIAMDKPDIVLLDIGLPQMSGYELAKLIRARPHPPRLVAVTGYGQESDRQRALAAGFDLHLVKPIDPEQLLAELGKLMSAGS